MTTLDWWALIFGLAIGGFIAGYKVIPDRIFREMSEREKK